MNNYIEPNWNAPKNVKAFTTKRTGGVSKPPYDSFNFTLLTGDNPEDVTTNRQQLCQELKLPREPFWLKQEHTNTPIYLDNDTQAREIVADASFTTTPGPVCVTLTADCVPILICDRAGTIVAAIHAGWKGIAVGIIGSTIKAMNTDPTKLLAWLGPAIGPQAFEVNGELINIFATQIPECRSAFIEHKDRYLANIYALASLFLNQAGVTNIFGGNYCTYTQRDLFYSFRRDGEKTGRMASLIWLDLGRV